MAAGLAGFGHMLGRRARLEVWLRPGLDGRPPGIVKRVCVGDLILINRVYAAIEGLEVEHRDPVHPDAGEAASDRLIGTILSGYRTVVVGRLAKGLFDPREADLLAVKERWDAMRARRPHPAA